MRQAYEGKLTDKSLDPIDYSKPSTGLAYVYRTFPAHADWVYKALSRIPKKLSAKLSNDPVKVACVGAGPGSDMMGVMKYAERNELADSTFKFTILDREEKWSTIRKALVSSLTPLSLKQRYVQLDLTKKDHWVSDWAFVDADIFTFSFVLSEVWRYNE